MSKKSKNRDSSLSFFLNICILLLCFFILLRIGSISKKLKIEDDTLAKVRHMNKSRLEANPIRNASCPVTKMASCSALQAEQDVCGGKNCCTPSDPSKDTSGSGCIPRDCADEFGGCAN